MGKFVYVYTGGQLADTPEAQEESMQAWGAWFGTLGGAISDPGNPFGASTVVGGEGTGNAGGYSIVTADTLDHAATMAKGCPVLLGGGTVEVYEAVPM
jgi:hypothetical protein